MLDLPYILNALKRLTPNDRPNHLTDREIERQDAALYNLCAMVVGALSTDKTPIEDLRTAAKAIVPYLPLLC